MPATNNLTPAVDHEQALRLLLPVWVREKEVTAAAFHNRPPGNPKRVEISVFVQDRLPSQDGNVLHVGKFADRGRARLLVETIRSVSYLKSGTLIPAEFDISITGEAEHPLAAYGNAHGHVSGPTHREKAASALANAFNVHGYLDRIPIKPIGPPPDTSQFQ
ncbi:MAG: hypothetical protein OXD50_13610 [Chloroflexi bacterium]|nr:hypothetical protein [Chloroflexota bacterium]